MSFITAKDGTQLYWRDWGQGTPILFLNSLGCNSRMWDYQITAFAEHGLRCIGFDRRGHGRSDEPARGYDYDTFTNDIATLIDKLDLPGLTLVGHSMAGGEIVRYLSQFQAVSARVKPGRRLSLTSERLLWRAWKFGLSVAYR